MRYSSVKKYIYISGAEALR